MVSIYVLMHKITNNVALHYRTTQINLGSAQFDQKVGD